MTPSDLPRRLAEVNRRIATAGATPGSVTVVAVTKGHGFSAVKAAIDAGVVDFGENYSAELLEKRAALSESGDTVRWHFLGHVQRNKVRGLASSVHLWQGLDRRAAGEEIARRAPGARVLVQVNVSDDRGRNGCGFDEAPHLVRALGDLGLDVRGVMAVGPVDHDEARIAYRRVNALAGDLGLVERSMGMSADLETAVEEGSTMVRVGQALFGARAARAGAADLRR